MEPWLQEAYSKIKRMPDKAKEIRERTKTDLYFFARLVNPGYMYGSIHKEVFEWMQEHSLFKDDEDLTSNKLVMLPRAHLKSHMVATWAAWIIRNHPEVSILYLSATSELAQTQLYAIQNILGSSIFMRYFPEFINPQEGKREKWSAFKLSVDHIKRKEEGIRDATISTAGLTTNTTGWHADLILADDLVVPENAYTEEGREMVSRKASQLTSIRNPGGFTMACGTVYHPKDIYKVWGEQIYSIYDEDGILLDKRPVWEVMKHKVEVDGIFIWPRVVREDGKGFGFNQNVLARIEAEYNDPVHFAAQYYNDPNDSKSERISRDKFQYYNPRYLKKEGSRWFYKGKRLNIYAAVDFAFSLTKEADYTAVVVVGMDCDGNVYVLDIERFKTNKIIDYFKAIALLHSKWRFMKLQAEVTVAQKVIVEAIKGHVKKEGLTLSVIDYRPSKAEGAKSERIAAILEPLYDGYSVWHLEGGWTGILEDELIQARPVHDDIKDAMASAVSIAIPPARSISTTIGDFFTTTKKQNRFGGVRN